MNASQSDRERARGRPDAVGDPDDHALPAVFLHLLYGTVAGSALGAAVVPRLGESETEVERVRGGTFWGLAYGLGLSQFGLSVVLERVLGMELDADERFVFHVGHALYGLTLGAWLGSNADDGA